MLRSPMAAVWRNREFVLLQLGQLLSSAGTSSTTIAYPLLALALTHSPAKAGIISFARLIPYALFGLVAGLAADRWNRKRLMIAADAVRAAAVGALAAAILLGYAEFWQIPVVAFVEGTGAMLFWSSYAGGLRAIVAAGELPAAVGAQRAREATVNLAARRSAARSSVSAVRFPSSSTRRPTSRRSSPSLPCG